MDITRTITGLKFSKHKVFSFKAPYGFKQFTKVTTRFLTNGFINEVSIKRGYSYLYYQFSYPNTSVNLLHVG